MNEPRPPTTCILSHPSIALLPQSLQPFIDELRDHLLQYGEVALRIVCEVSSHALLHVLANLVDLNVDLVAGLLARSDDLLLGVCNQHDFPPTLGTVLHFCNRQTRSIYCDIALFDDVAQHSRVSRLEAEREGVAVGRDGLDRRNGVDMALNKMAAHAGVCRDCALKVDLGALLQRAQVGATECLGSTSNLERLLVELGDG